MLLKLGQTKKSRGKVVPRDCFNVMYSTSLPIKRQSCKSLGKQKKSARQNCAAQFFNVMYSTSLPLKKQSCKNLGKQKKNPRSKVVPRIFLNVMYSTSLPIKRRSCKNMGKQQQQKTESIGSFFDRLPVVLYLLNSLKFFDRLLIGTWD